MAYWLWHIFIVLILLKPFNFQAFSKLVKEIWCDTWQTFLYLLHFIFCVEDHFNSYRLIATFFNQTLQFLISPLVLDKFCLLVLYFFHFWIEGHRILMTMTIIGLTSERDSSLLHFFFLKGWNAVDYFVLKSGNVLLIFLMNCLHLLLQLNFVLLQYLNSILLPSQFSVGSVFVEFLKRFRCNIGSRCCSC